MMTVGVARYQTLPLDEDINGLDAINVSVVQDCIVLSFKRLQEIVAKRNETIRNEEPALNQFAESIDLLFTHKLKNKKNSFWNLVKEISFRDVIDSISNLALVSTNLGRARAWIYQAIQDGLLTCYLSQLSNDHKLLSKHYKPDAAICDSDLMFIVSGLLTGLENMTFDLTMDCSSFDTGVAPSSTKKTFFGASSTFDDFSLSTMDNVVMHIPSLLGSKISRTTQNSSKTSLNSVESLEASSVYSFDVESVTGRDGRLTVPSSQNQRSSSKGRRKQRTKKNIAAASSSAFQTTEYKDENTTSAPVVAALPEMKANETPTLFGQDKTVDADDVLALMAAKLKEANKESGVTDHTVKRVMERRNEDMGTRGGDDKVDKLLLPTKGVDIVTSTSAKNSKESLLTASFAEGDSHPVSQMKNLSLEDSSEMSRRVKAHRDPSPFRARGDRSTLVGVKRIEVDLGLDSSTDSSGQHGLEKSTEVDSQARLHAIRPTDDHLKSFSCEDSGSISIEMSRAPALHIDNSLLMENTGRFSPLPESLHESHEDSSMFVSSLFTADSPGGSPKTKEEFVFLPKTKGLKNDLVTHENRVAKINVQPDGVSLNSWLSNRSSNLVTDDSSGGTDYERFSTPDRHLSPLVGRRAVKTPAPKTEEDLESKVKDLSVAQKEDSLQLESLASFDEGQLLGASVKIDHNIKSNQSGASNLLGVPQSQIATALSATLYVAENAVAFHKSDIFIDHMMQLNFEIKIFQFNQDGEEQAMKLFRGFYRHMEMPSSWTKKAYHARPIDLLVTNRALYLLKFEGEKADTLHYFFPLEEISLISVYPFGQGFKIFSRRPALSDWSKVSANDSQRVGEFWFETGDEELTSMIIQKVNETAAFNLEDNNVSKLRFGDNALMEMVQLRKFMAFTFGYEVDHRAHHEIRRLCLVHMGESPPLDGDDTFSSGTHNSSFSDSQQKPPRISTGSTSGSMSSSTCSLEGVLWIKEEVGSFVGGLVRKPTISFGKNSHYWRDYNFSIRNATLYRAEYSAGKISNTEAFISLKSCVGVKVYKDADKPHTFCVSVNKPQFGISSILPGKPAAKNKMGVTYCFAARTEKEASDWVHAIRNLLPASSASVKPKVGRSIPVKACALVMDDLHVVLCRYERETEDFFVLEKFALRDISRVITVGTDKDEAHASPTFLVLDFKSASGGDEDEEDDFEMVENNNLVDNLLPMALFFCAQSECQIFISLLQQSIPTLKTISFTEANLQSTVLKSLSKTHVDLLRYRMLDKV